MEVASRVDRALLTCEAVLAETAFPLAKRYADRKPDLADLCLIRLSETNPSLPVITTDVRDFRIYRRGRREMIPLIHPDM